VAHDFNSAIIEEQDHRPWPMPDRSWAMTQTWHDLLFAHWPIAAHDLRAKVPPAFELDLFHGDAWVGIVPFRMTNVAPRGVPALRWLSEFPELNVRTYVRAEGRPGVFFFSLDAGSRFAVHTARTLFNLPYFTATINLGLHDGAVRYQSRRERSKVPATLVAEYAPDGAVFEAGPGSLEYFLTERYCLYNVTRRGEPYCLQIHHPPWRLRTATAEFRRNTMPDANGLRLPGCAPLLHFVERQDMVAWMPEPLPRRRQDRATRG
jgi:uncharacterized protein YqjF (DUF2071 family)